MKIFEFHNLTIPMEKKGELERKSSPRGDFEFGLIISVSLWRYVSREKIQVMLDWLTKGSLSMLVTVARASKAFVPLKKKTGEKGVRNLLYSISRALRKNKPSYHLIIVIDSKEWCQSILVKVIKIRFYVKFYDATEIWKYIEFVVAGFLDDRSKCLEFAINSWVCPVKKN